MCRRPKVKGLKISISFNFYIFLLNKKHMRWLKSYIFAGVGMLSICFLFKWKRLRNAEVEILIEVVLNFNSKDIFFRYQSLGKSHWIVCLREEESWDFYSSSFLIQDIRRQDRDCWPVKRKSNFRVKRKAGEDNSLLQYKENSVC